MVSLKARVILKQNITALLQARRLSQRDLAFACRKTESWISQILTNPERGMRMPDLDCIADFFGLEVYQLFSPGISPLAERRSGKDRRTGMDRRVSDVTEIREPVPSLAEIQAHASRLQGEDYRRFARRARALLTLLERTPGITDRPGLPGTTGLQDEPIRGSQREHPSGSKKGA